MNLNQFYQNTEKKTAYFINMYWSDFSFDTFCWNLNFKNYSLPWNFFWEADFCILFTTENPILKLELIPSMRNPQGSQKVRKYPNSDTYPNNDTFFDVTKMSLLWVGCSTKSTFWTSRARKVKKTNISPNFGALNPNLMRKFRKMKRKK